MIMMMMIIMLLIKVIMMITGPSLYEMAALTNELDTLAITTKVKEILMAHNVGQKVNIIAIIINANVIVIINVHVIVMVIVLFLIIAKFKECLINLVNHELDQKHI